jgi:hypothetical protein
MCVCVCVWLVGSGSNWPEVKDKRANVHARGTDCVHVAAVFVLFVARGRSIVQVAQTCI